MGDKKSAVEKLMQGAVQAAADTEEKTVYCQLDAIGALYEGISKAGRIIKEGEALQTAQGVCADKT